jgi:hypothetical protein
MVIIKENFSFSKTTSTADSEIPVKEWINEPLQ